MAKNKNSSFSATKIPPSKVYGQDHQSFDIGVLNSVKGKLCLDQIESRCSS